MAVSGLSPWQPLTPAPFPVGRHVWSPGSLQTPDLSWTGDVKAASTVTEQPHAVEKGKRKTNFLQEENDQKSVLGWTDANPASPPKVMALREIDFGRRRTCAHPCTPVTPDYPRRARCYRATALRSAEGGSSGRRFHLDGVGGGLSPVRHRWKGRRLP